MSRGPVIVAMTRRPEAMQMRDGRLRALAVVDVDEAGLRSLGRAADQDDRDAGGRSRAGSGSFSCRLTSRAPSTWPAVR